MKKTLTFLMFGLAVAGIACNVQFYSSVSDGIGSFFYGLIGLLFDVSKLTLIVLAVYFYYRNSVNHAIASLAGWFVLSGISLVAAYGFFGVLNAEYEQKQLAQSNVYGMSKQSVESANAKVESLSQYADADFVRLAEIDKKKLETQRNGILHGNVQNSLGTNVGSLDRMTSGCTQENWYSRRYCGQLTEIDSKISELDDRINGHAMYASAIEHRDGAMANLTGLSPASVEQSHHPVFILLATVLATSAHNVKAWFLLLTSFVLEALASLLFYLRASLYHEDNDAISVTTDSSVHEKKTDTFAAQSPRGVENDAISVNNDTISVFERIKNELKNAKLDTPSFPKLRKMGLKDKEIKKVRQMLIDSKTCVQDVTGKLVVIP